MKVAPIWGWAIVEQTNKGRGRLFHGTNPSRLACIAEFCRDMDTRPRAEREANPLRGHAYGALDELTKEQWERHKLRGRRCVKVQVSVVD